MTWRGRTWVAAASVLLLLPGCTGDEPVGEPTAGATTAADVAPEAGQLRLRLEREFGLHASLAAEAVLARGAAADTALAALEDNGEELSATLGAALGDDDAESFRDVWDDYLFELQRYTDALADEDAPLAMEARGRLLSVPRRLSEYLSAATDEGAAVSETTALVRQPLSHIVRVVDDAGARDFEGAYAEGRKAYAGMVQVGTAFAAAISEHDPNAFPGPRNSGALELQSALHQLLGEHALLVATVVRRGAKDSPDFEAAAAALNGNTEDLRAAWASIYPAHTTSITTAWRNRISLLAEYTVAAAGKKDTAAQDLRDDLADADLNLARLLAAASDDAIASKGTRKRLAQATRFMGEQVDAWLAEDYDLAQDHMVDAYRQAIALASDVAAGIVAHKPEEFPVR